ncbi:MAG: hypothetical protein JWL86_815 [Rhizobium sp.]|nr:hypothetical protein [Rhizobium sp.]
MIPHREVINNVLRERLVGKRDFYSASRFPHLVEARKIAAERLAEQGASPYLIGRVLHRDRSTILHYLRPDIRARKRRHYERRRAIARSPSLQASEAGS